MWKVFRACMLWIYAIKCKQNIISLDPRDKITTRLTLKQFAFMQVGRTPAYYSRDIGTPLKLVSGKRLRCET